MTSRAIAFHRPSGALFGAGECGQAHGDRGGAFGDAVSAFGCGDVTVADGVARVFGGFGDIVGLDLGVLLCFGRASVLLANAGETFVLPLFVYAKNETRAFASDNAPRERR